MQKHHNKMKNLTENKGNKASANETVTKIDKSKDYKEQDVYFDMAMYPFTRNKKQKIWSAIIFIFSVVLMITNPFQNIRGIPITGFIIGLVFGAVSLIYLFDSL